MLEFSALADQPKPVLLIAGATATGKSRFALDVAQRHDGAIINADSMQIYRAIPILTAQPSASERAIAAHALYGVLEPDDVCSAPRWADLAKEQIEACWRAGTFPIVVGGTGLYLRTLLEGMSPIPDIVPEVRQEVRRRLEQHGSGAIVDALKPLDPILADRLSSNDSQRLCRALEVALSTGRPLSSWQNEPSVGGLRAMAGVSIETLVLDVERDVLYERCNQRLELMLQDGALVELEDLLAKQVARNRPVMRAVGVPPLAAYLHGDSSKADALDLAKRDTRRFAKRQNTWLRNQFEKWNWYKW